MELIHSLDIGSRHVKLVTLREDRDTLFLADHKEAELPAETLVTRQGKSMLKNPEALEQRLVKLLAPLKSKRKEVMVSLPDHCATILFKHVEKLFDDKMKQDYVRWRLRKILAPSLVNNSLLDYQVLGRQETDDGISFYVVVEIIKEQLLNDISHLIMKAGFIPLYFDINSFGLANLYQEFLTRYPEKTSNYMIINMGHMATTFSFFRDRVLCYLRTVPIGGFHFAEKIAMLKDTDRKGAETILQNTDFFTGKTIDLETIEQVFGAWLKELDVTVQFYNKNNLLGKLEKIFLGGGTSQIMQLDEFLFSVTGTRAEVISLNSLLDTKDPDTDGSRLTATLGAAVGNVLREERTP